MNKHEYTYLYTLYSLYNFWKAYLIYLIFEGYTYHIL